MNEQTKNIRRKSAIMTVSVPPSIARDMRSTARRTARPLSQYVRDLHLTAQNGLAITLPTDLAAKVKAKAEASGRSVSQFIVDLFLADEAKVS